MESKSQGSYPTSATDKRCCPLLRMISDRMKKDTNSISPAMISSEGEDEETGVDRVMTISLLSSESESEEEMDEKAEGEWVLGWVGGRVSE